MKIENFFNKITATPFVFYDKPVIFLGANNEENFETIDIIKDIVLTLNLDIQFKKISDSSEIIVAPNIVYLISLEELRNRNYTIFKFSSQSQDKKDFWKLFSESILKFIKDPKLYSFKELYCIWKTVYFLNISFKSFIKIEEEHKEYEFAINYLMDNTTQTQRLLKENLIWVKFKNYILELILFKDYVSAEMPLDEIFKHFKNRLNMLELAKKYKMTVLKNLYMKILDIEFYSKNSTDLTKFIMLVYDGKITF